jgi:hypothetical protein
MKRTLLGALAICTCIVLPPAANAQLGGGMNFFHKPNIADIFHPVVGSGAAYERSDKDGVKTALEMTIVGRDTFEGKDAYWFEVGHNDKRNAEMSYAKMLVTKDDFQFHKMIIVMPGSAQPMEMPFNPGDKTKEKMKDDLEKWHKVGAEPITVPAGTFLCEHWQKDDGKQDVWVSSKVTPMGMVKEVSEHSTMVLTKVISGASDHITGTPQKFDPQMMRQMMMQQMQKNKEDQ